MSKSVSVILNSNNAVSGDTQKANYYMNWSAILDNKKSYTMHWTYLGGANVYNGSKLPCVYLSFNTNSYMANSNGAPSTLMVGFLKPIVLVGSTGTVYFTAEDNTNLPLYIEANSMSPNFSVSILNTANPPVPYTDNTSPTPINPASYVLSLRFIEN
jgi:hypothetical protein